MCPAFRSAQKRFVLLKQKHALHCILESWYLFWSNRPACREKAKGFGALSEASEFISVNYKVI